MSNAGFLLIHLNVAEGAHRDAECYGLTFQRCWGG